MNQLLLTQKIGFLANGFGVNIADRRMEFYAKVLAGLTEEQLDQAIEYASQQCKFFPSPAELLELAGIELPQHSIAKEAEQAWMDIRAYHGDLKAMPLDNIQLQVVKEMGGRGTTGTSFGKWEMKQEGYKQQEFLKRYHALRETMPLRRHSALEAPRQDNRPQDDYDHRFGKLCALNITEIIVKQSDLGARKAKMEIMQALNDPDFDGHTFNWVAPNGMRPQVWLRAEVEKRMPSVVA